MNRIATGGYDMGFAGLAALIEFLANNPSNKTQAVFMVYETAPAAIFTLNWLSATGTGILVAALLAGAVMRYSPRELFRIYLETIYRVRFSLITIAAMLALGYVTKYSGTDATLGLALAERYGGTERYLLDAGVNPEDLARVRERLVEG